MRCRPAIQAIAFAALAQCIAVRAQAPAAASEIETIREHNAALLAHLPEFTCVETIDRSVRRAREKRFRPLETMHLDVAYAGGEEVHLWPGASKFENARLVRRIEDGAISDGDFATHALNVFVRGKGLIEPAGDDVALGVRTRAFRFRMAQAENGWTLSNRGISRAVAAEGRLWTDARSLDLLRMIVSARDIPAELRIARLEMRIDYGTRGIGHDRVLLPRTSELELDLANGVENRTAADFGGCRKFGSNAAMMSWSLF